MKKKVKVIGAVILVLLAAAMAGAMLLSPLSLEAVVLERTTAKVTFTEQGSYQYDRNLDIYPQISGQVLDIAVKQGQAVKKGDTLAVVLASDYEYQIKSLESAIAGYQAQISHLNIQEQEKQSELGAGRQTLLGQLAEVELGIKNYENTEESLFRQIDLQESIVSQNSNMATIAREELADARQDYRNGILDQAQYNAIRAAHNQAETVLDASRQQLEQLRTGNVTMETYDAQRDSINAQLDLLEKRISRDTAEAMIRYYNSVIESTRQDIASLTEKLGQANITSPVDGVVSELPAEDANILSQQVKAATISSDPFVEVFVPVREIDGVRTGDKVELILSKRLGDETLAGTVSGIEDEARIKLSALGVEERKVRVIITPESGDLRIGFSMDVKFTVFEQPDCVVAPKTAVFEKDGQDMVWVIDNGILRMRAVEKGVETREGYAILSGLSDGDAVVTDANTEGIAEGKRAKIV